MNLDFATIKELLEFYIEDLPCNDIVVLEAEFELWQRHWRGHNDNNATNFVEVFKALGPQRMFFPNIVQLLEIYAVLPVSVASVERSFSTSKLIKTFLRNKTGDERLSSLALLSIHKSITSQLNPDKVVDLFAKKIDALNLLISSQILN